MDTHKENAHPSRMCRLNTHKQAFESCYLMTVFEDPGFVLVLPIVFGFRALAISSFPLLLFPLLPSLLLPSSPSSLSSLLPPFLFSPLLSLLHPTSPLPSSPLPSLALPSFSSFPLSLVEIPRDKHYCCSPCSLELRRGLQVKT